MFDQVLLQIDWPYHSTQVSSLSSRSAASILCERSKDPRATDHFGDADANNDSELEDEEALLIVQYGPTILLLRRLRRVLR